MGPDIFFKALLPLSVKSSNCCFCNIYLQGNRLFKEGKYDLAKAKYEKVLSAPLMVL